ncbi:hypothetical protein BHM03_00011498 [Ensete ventricosum]|nr:hypothetical protein BHM03_00011498 [Ensete ventricosum]
MREGEESHAFRLPWGMRPFLHRLSFVRVRVGEGKILRGARLSCREEEEREDQRSHVSRHGCRDGSGGTCRVSIFGGHEGVDLGLLIADYLKNR